MEWKEKLTDLRFIVGLYFVAVSVILALASSLGYGTRDGAFNVNLAVAIAAAALSAMMLTLSHLRPALRQAD